MPSHSIYALCDPDTGDVRYIGRTEYPIQFRLSRHIQQAKGCSAQTQNRPVLVWISRLAAQGKRPTIKLIEECQPSDARDLEAKWIAMHVEQGGDILNVLERSGVLKHPGSKRKMRGHLFRAPAELADRFDLVVQAKYTTRSALVRELMAREVEAFFATRPQARNHDPA